MEWVDASSAKTCSKNSPAELPESLERVLRGEKVQGDRGPESQGA